jgi:hypothetical protein
VLYDAERELYSAFVWKKERNSGWEASIEPPNLGGEIMT